MTLISIKIEGETTTHIAEGTGNYATICGQSIDDDPDICGDVVPTQKLVTCPSCIGTWRACRTVRAGQIDHGLE